MGASHNPAQIPMLDLLIHEQFGREALFMLTTVQYASFSLIVLTLERTERFHEPSNPVCELYRSAVDRRLLR